MASTRAIGRINGSLSEITDLKADTFNEIIFTRGGSSNATSFFFGGSQITNAHTGSSVIAMGFSSMQAAVSNYETVAVGVFTGTALTSGGSNVFIGQEAASFGVSLNRTIAIGAYALMYADGSEENVALGYQAGINTFAGARNLFLGTWSGYNHDDSSDKLWIANSNSGTGSNLITGNFATGKVGININPSNISPCAAFQIESTTGGFVPPRLTTTQRDALTSLVEGLEIYNVTLHAKQVYTNSGWTSLGSGSSSALVVATVTADTTITNQDVILNNKATAASHTLPSAVGYTKRLTLKQIGSQDATFTGVLGQTVDGNSSITLRGATKQSVTLISDNANWWII